MVQGDYLAYLSGCRETFGLVFLDPPYGTGLLEKSLSTIAAIDIVAGNGIIVCESGTDWTVPSLMPPYETGREYRYGQIKLTLCRRAGSVRQ